MTEGNNYEQLGGGGSIRVALPAVCLSVGVSLLRETRRNEDSWSQLEATN